MKRKLKIAIYSGSIPSTTFIENLIEEVALNHEVLVFGNIKKNTQYSSNNIKIIETPYNKWRYIPLTLWRLLLLLFSNPKYIFVAFNRAKHYPTNYLKFIRFTRYIAVLLYKPDIFHLQWARRLDRWTFLKDTYDCKIILSLLGTQIAVAPHSNKALANSFKYYFPKVDRLVSVSQHTAREAIQFNADKSNIQILHMPISAYAFSLFRLPKRTSDSAIKIVSVGRHDWVKGYRYGIDALHALVLKNVDVHYTIIAQGQVPEALIFQVHQLGLTSHVSFISGLNQKDLFEAVQSQDIMLLPSVTEGIANVTIEAMALGVPVISTNCGGMSEVIIDDLTGWLVPVRDSEAICYAVEKIRRIPELKLQEIVQNAFNLVNEQFNPKTIMPQFMRLYEQLIFKNK